MRWADRTCSSAIPQERTSRGRPQRWARTTSTGRPSLKRGEKQSIQKFCNEKSNLLKKIVGTTRSWSWRTPSTPQSWPWKRASRAREEIQTFSSHFSHACLWHSIRKARKYVLFLKCNCLNTNSKRFWGFDTWTLLEVWISRPTDDGGQRGDRRVRCQRLQAVHARRGQGLPHQHCVKIEERYLKFENVFPPPPFLLSWITCKLNF